MARNGRRVTCTLSEEIIEALEKLARVEQRDRSSLIRKILVEYIEGKNV